MARILLAAFAALVSASIMYTACAIMARPALSLFRFEQQGRDRIFFLILPTFVGIVAFGLMLLLLPRSRNRVLGHCPQCAYDLTGNVSGVCPECGRLLEQESRLGK